MRPVMTAVLLLLGVGICANSADGQEAAKPGTILDSNSSYWRVYYTVKPPVMRDGAGLKKVPTMTDDTDPPAKDWAGVEFNDSQWARVVGRPLSGRQGYNPAKGQADAGLVSGEGSSPALAMISMRGKFGVTDPAAVKDLKLSLRYRGGVIVYVNGQEVGRGNMAKDANGPDAVAEDYPKDAFVGADGSPEIKSPRGGDGSAPAAYTARARSADITIPASALRKGTNILAIEVHRAAYMEGYDQLIQSKKLTYQLYDIMWATCGLTGATLQAATPAGLTPNIARPKGFQVWNSQPMQPDFDLDYGDPFEPLGAISMVGTRNGFCSGKVVAGSDQPIKGLKAAVSDLTGKSGGTIPATAVQVRYGMPTGEEPVLETHFPAMPDLMDGLAETAPATVEVRSKNRGAWSFGAVCPVWVTVAVPDKAAPGDYTGKLTISAEGQKPVEVPVNLKVCNYQMPKSSEWRTVLDIMQSPETVAMQYDVPFWSDKHLKLLEKSLERAGYIGSWTLHIPLIAHSNLGNDESMVRWIKQPDGNYKFDFTPVEKYLALAEKHMGKPRSVDLVVWDLFLGMSGLAENPHFLEHNTTLTTTEPQDITVTMLDAPGKTSMGTVGRYDDKGKPQWKALITQLMPLLKEHGLDKSIHIGHSYDLCPTDQIAIFWSELLPGVQYFRYGHYDYRTFGKTPAGKSDFIVHEWAPNWSNKPVYGWKNPIVDLPWVRLKSERGSSGAVWKSDPYVTMPTNFFRLLGEECIQGPFRGFGRMGLDYWPVMKNAKGEKVMAIQGRYPSSSWRQSDEMILSIVPPGPDGALSSAKLEMMREGLQDTEARIFLESVMIDPAKKGKLPAALAAKAQAVLDGRVKALQMVLERQPVAGFYTTRDGGAPLDGFSFGGLFAMNHSAIFQKWYLASGWQNRTEQLFAVAAEVSAAVGGK